MALINNASYQQSNEKYRNHRPTSSQQHAQHHHQHQQQQDYDHLHRRPPPSYNQHHQQQSTLAYHHQQHSNHYQSSAYHPQQRPHTATPPATMTPRPYSRSHSPYLVSRTPPPTMSPMMTQGYSHHAYDMNDNRIPMIAVNGHALGAPMQYLTKRPGLGPGPIIPRCAGQSGSLPSFMAQRRGSMSGVPLLNSVPHSRPPSAHSYSFGRLPLHATPTPVGTPPPSFDINLRDPLVMPDGLRPLMEAQGLLFNKQHEWFGGDRVLNKYVVSDGAGRPLFAANEVTDKMTLSQSQRTRPFLISVVDANAIEVIKVSRPADACWSCCPLFSRPLNEVTVLTPAGQIMGTARMTSTFTPTFIIKDQNSASILRIEGGIVRLFDKDFAIYDMTTGGQFSNTATAQATATTVTATPTKTFSRFNRQRPLPANQIGRITEESRFFGHDIWSTFPRDLPVTVKATLMGVIFLLEILYFETSFPVSDISRVFV